MPVEILGLHHYTLRTRDLKRAAAFYEGVFGLKRKPQPAMITRAIRYDLDGVMELQLLETDELPDRADAPDPREGHPALEVDNIHNAVAACLAGGAEMQQVTFIRDEDGSQSAFLREPDGNLLELCSFPGRLSRRAAPALPSRLIAAEGSRPPMASAPSLPEEMIGARHENYFSNRKQRRENWQLILTLVVAAVLIGIGYLLRVTVFQSRTSSIRPTASPDATATKSAATPSAIPTATPTPEAITPSLSETGGVPGAP